MGRLFPHFLKVMVPHFLGEQILNPWVNQSFGGGDSLGGLPLQTPLNEMDEVLVDVLQFLVEAPAERGVDLAVGVLDGPELATFVEEFLPGDLLEEAVGRRAEDLDHHADLLGLALAGEDGGAGEQLIEDAPEAPHVDGGGVLDPEHDLRRPVVAALDVGVHDVTGAAGAAHVDDPEAALVLLPQHHVLRLQVAVDEIVAREKEQSLQDLDREPVDQLQREPLELVLLQELVEIEMEELERETLR